MGHPSSQSRQGFREEIHKLLNSRSTGIRGESARRLMPLTSADNVTSAGTSAAFDKCKNVLYLKDNINPFDVFADLDERTDDYSADLAPS
jgi:hypothetical protein